MVLAYLSGHRRACKHKQSERAARIASLPAVYHEALTTADTSILATPLDKLVANIKKGEVKPLDVLRAYGKEAIRAQAETNCLTEIMIEDAEKWASENELKGPLAGIPGISICISANRQSPSKILSMFKGMILVLGTLRGPQSLRHKILLWSDVSKTPGQFHLSRLMYRHHC
jgi:hypothetical protein